VSRIDEIEDRLLRANNRFRAELIRQSAELAAKEEEISALKETTKLSVREYHSCLDELAKLDGDGKESHREIHIVFDGPPSHESGRFIEVEDGDGHSINFGEWRERPDGLWALVFNVYDTILAAHVPAGRGEGGGT
jgi:hypothetical protein